MALSESGQNVMWGIDWLNIVMRKGLVDKTESDGHKSQQCEIFYISVSDPDPGVNKKVKNVE